MTRAILVGGTFAFRGSIPVGAWYSPTSLFSAMLTGLGLDVAGSRPGERAFTWSTDLDGIFESDHVDWKAGGASLLEYISPSLCQGARIAPADTTIIAHSHARQIVLYAAAAGLRIGHLVTVCGPVRFDMEDVAKKARPNIGTWTALTSDDTDWIEILGEDQWCPTREETLADANIVVAGAGHTGLVDDPLYFKRWQENSQWLS